jgi:hypothetical protein
MKKRTFLLVTIAMVLFTACNESRSGKRKPQVKTDSLSVKTTVDSLQEIISGLVSSDYDRQVKALKKMPEYEHAVFLTKVETQEFLEKFSSVKERFKFRNEFCTEEDKKWIPVEDDSIVVKSYCQFNLKIVYDTTQSINPIAQAYAFTQFQKKNRNAADNTKDVDVDEYNISFYYLKSFGVLYYILTSDDVETGTHYFDDMDIFEARLKTLI